jgi:hypothetical protein
MRFHGFVMILLGSALISQLKRIDELTKIIVRLFCGWCMIVTVTIFGSWWVTGVVVFGAPWVWLAFAAISGVMILYPPPAILRSNDGPE